jgi:hypothetical protein
VSTPSTPETSRAAIASANSRIASHEAAERAQRRHADAQRVIVALVDERHVGDPDPGRAAEVAEVEAPLGRRDRDVEPDVPCLGEDGLRRPIDHVERDRHLPRRARRDQEAARRQPGARRERPGVLPLAVRRRRRRHPGLTPLVHLYPCGHSHP